jgi:hypothetical protein
MIECFHNRDLVSYLASHCTVYTRVALASTCKLLYEKLHKSPLIEDWANLNVEQRYLKAIEENQEEIANHYERDRKANFEDFWKKYGLWCIKYDRLLMFDHVKDTILRNRRAVPSKWIKTIFALKRKSFWDCIECMTHPFTKTVLNYAGPFIIKGAIKSGDIEWIRYCWDNYKPKKEREHEQLVTHALTHANMNSITLDGKTFYMKKGTGCSIFYENDEEIEMYFKKANRSLRNCLSLGKSIFRDERLGLLGIYFKSFQDREFFDIDHVKHLVLFTVENCHVDTCIALMSHVPQISIDTWFMYACQNLRFDLVQYIFKQPNVDDMTLPMWEDILFQKNIQWFKCTRLFRFLLHRYTLKQGYVLRKRVKL